MQPIQMVDLKTQYLRLKDGIDSAIQECINSTAFINGPQVKSFQTNLEAYLGEGVHVIPCANGTDALQIALMALDLKPGDEVLVPSFTYVATAEVIALLKLVPVMVDANPRTFNVDVEELKKGLTSRTKAIVPVHLFGQCAEMDEIMTFAEEHGLYVVEDTAQALGADYTSSTGITSKAGTIGHIGCTSFFPSKNLGCFGDGGAIFTRDSQLAQQIRMIANHGQQRKYHHHVIGVNSRLDTLQAAILDVKLKELDNFASARRAVADAYDAAFKDIEWLKTPARSSFSTHVFHQYTLIVKEEYRDALKQHLENKGVPSMIYYPVPLQHQEAFKKITVSVGALHVTEHLCKQVLSLPIHTEMTDEHLQYIIKSVKEFIP